MRRTHRRGRHTGFTLIEMIIAALILVLGVAAAMGAISASTNTEAYANQIQTASLLAQRQLAELATQPDTLAGGGDQEGNFDEPYSNYHWKATVESSDYQNLFKVTMTVTWGAPRTYQRVVTTYLRSDQNTISRDIQTNYQNYQNNQNSSSTGTSAGTNGGTSGQ